MRWKIILGVTVLGVSALGAAAQERTAAERSQTREAMRSATERMFDYSHVPSSDAARDGPRVVNGVDAEVAGLFEFTGSMRKPGYPHFCGGSFVSPRIETRNGKKHVAEWRSGDDKPEWFVTAAHCIADDDGEVMSAADLTIIGGVRDITDSAKVEIGVEEIIKHPGYWPNDPDTNDALKNDIALIRLKKIPSGGSPAHKLRSITLPQARDGNIVYAEGSKLEVNGWGRTESGPISLFLQTAALPFSDQDWCRSSYANAGAVVSPGAFCAGFTQGGTDSCSGDSGGPLFFGIESGYSPDPILAGVVSWGIGCALPGYLGVYSSTFYFKRWIERTVVDRS